MGTSGAYGGSGSKPWREAHDAVANMPTNRPPRSSVQQAVQQIATAIEKQNPGLRRRPAANAYTPETLFSRGGTSGTSSSGGSRRGSGGGFSGSNAARGAAVIGAGHALLGGSQADLDALGVGLRLQDMDGLSVREQCQYILDKVLGAPGSLDEEILRRAALDALKQLLTNQTQTPDESVSAFMAEYVYQTTLVQLTSVKASKKLTPAQVLKQERHLKQWIRKTVKFSGVVDGPRLSVRALMAKAGDFCNRALNLLKGTK
jgi:hypothetical protein